MYLSYWAEDGRTARSLSEFKNTVAPICKVLPIQKHWSQILVQKYDFGYCLGNGCETEFMVDANDFVVNTAYGQGKLRNLYNMVEIL